MAGKCGFEPNRVVTDPKELFGHNRPGGLLERLTAKVLAGEPCQVMGELRSGKSSLLQCCMRRIAHEEPLLVPVCVNFRENSDVVGYGEAYRFILASVHDAVASSHGSELPEIIDLGKAKLTREGTLIESRAVLAEVSPAYTGHMLEVYLNIVADEGIGVALFLDEFEHLMQRTFENIPGSFFRLRELSSKLRPRIPEAPYPFTFVVAARVPWRQLCNIEDGSPEANTITTAPFTVGPLDGESFREMWEDCIAGSSENIREAIAISGLSWERVEGLAGGWPFYGKVVGSALSDGTLDEELYLSNLSDHFENLWSGRTRIGERIIKVLQEAVDEADGEDLVERGLLNKIGPGAFKPRGTLWERFVLERADRHYREVIQSKSLPTGAPHPEQWTLVSKIVDVITEINQNSKASGKGLVFADSPRNWKLQRDLLNPAHCEDELKPFATALYDLLFEKTAALVQDSRTGVEVRRTRASLDRRFREKGILKDVGGLRHHFDHDTSIVFEHGPVSRPIEEIRYKYIRTRKQPRNQECVALQIGILREVLKFLEKVNEFLHNELA